MGVKSRSQQIASYTRDQLNIGFLNTLYIYIWVLDFRKTWQIFWLVKWWPWLMLLLQCAIKLYNYYTYIHEYYWLMYKNLVATYVHNILTLISGIKVITLPGRLSSWRNNGNNVPLGCAIHRRHILLKSSVILTLNAQWHIHVYFILHQYNSTVKYTCYEYITSSPRSLLFLPPRLGTEVSYMFKISFKGIATFIRRFILL